MLLSDNRAVQDLERKSALMHFGSEQAAKMSGRTSRLVVSARRVNPRTAHVHSLAKPPSCKPSRIHVMFVVIFCLPHCFNSGSSVYYLS